VVNLLAAPPLQGAVAGAISASGGGDHVATHTQATAISELFLSTLGIAPDHIGEVRHVPARDIVAAQEAIATGPRGTWIWRPVLGGPALPVRPIDAIAAGAAQGVALLAGSNGNEGITYQRGDASTAEQAPRVLRELFGDAHAERMLDGYRAARPGADEVAIGTAIVGDERYGMPTTRLADAQAAHGPVWRYRFDGRFPGADPEMAGGHGMDMMPIWAPLPADAAAPAARTADGQHAEAEHLAGMVRAMRNRWANLALRGDPNPLAGSASDAIPSWPQYGPTRATMIIDAVSRVQDDPRAEERSLWGDRVWPSGTWWAFDGA